MFPPSVCLEGESLMMRRRPHTRAANKKKNQNLKLKLKIFSERRRSFWPDVSKRIRTNLLGILKLFSKKRKEIRVEGNHQFGPTRGENNVFCCNGRRAIRKKTFEGFSLPCWKPSRMEELEINSYSFFFCFFQGWDARVKFVTWRTREETEMCERSHVARPEMCRTREKWEKSAGTSKERACLVYSIVAIYIFYWWWW